ncbi:MAG: hypothetical protein OEM62_01130 [Acidobacteriota bacterium]|nr:hypothetical protein [Acidobacteriota bacterium]
MSKRLSMFATAVVTLLSACETPEPPVGGLNIEPRAIEMAYPAFVPVALEWTMSRPLAGLSGTPRVFLHLLGADGDVVRTFDHDLPREWTVGSNLSYEVMLSQSALVPALPSGQYALVAGLYDAAEHRWPLTVQGEEVRHLEYRIATVTVSASSSAPSFFFSPAWLPVEGGTDLQILARRWLENDGVLRLSELSGAGMLYMRIGVPQGGGPQELVVEGDTSLPTVRLETTCGDWETAISGSGSHVVEMPVVPGEGETVCDIAFSADFYLLSRDNLSRRTMALEELSWSSGP